MDTTATVLPIHATPSSTKAIADGGLHERSRRRCLICAIATAAVLLLLAVTLVVLFLTVLRVRDPSTRLVSAQLVGLAPNLTPPLQFNVTLLLTVAVHNPNPASFSFASGSAQLWYRGVLVGNADVEPGRVPSRGDGTMEMVMTVLSDSFTPDMMAQLIKDVEAGGVPLDADARIPGKVAVFGFIKLHAVAYSDCHVVFGVPEMSVRSQECRDHTKL
ncbi:hypothetical protein QOZ80_7AG0567680 [Eleusine coracana subsp. coracana]|nr:hypothetical protein QOZ80_7AG0567680 [Eleusine coracana subsp. coracana]